MVSQRPLPKCPLHIVSALALLVGDWFIYAANLATYAERFWVVDGGGAIAAAVLTATIESQLGKASVRAAWSKALAVGAIVLVPLPLLGSLAAVIVVLWHFFVWLSLHDTSRTAGSDTKQNG